MTEDERHKLETMAQEAERLRTDPSFAAAVIATREQAAQELRTAESEMVAALLADGDLGVTRANVVRLRAKIEAIDELCTEIGAQILRGTPRKLMPVA